MITCVVRDRSWQYAKVLRSWSCSIGHFQWKAGTSSKPMMVHTVLGRMQAQTSNL